MWSILHDTFVAFALGLHLLWRWARGLFTRDSSSVGYVSYRSGRRIGELKNDGRPLLWFHGVSVGEVAALDGIISQIRARQKAKISIAVSTMTSEGLRAARRLTDPPDIAFIYPLDLSFFARRIVKRLRPQALVIFDGDFWFQMLNACYRAQVPVVVINGRMSERSARNRARVASYSKRLLSRVALASVQSQVMADRFAECFVPRDRIVVDGNVKLDFTPAPLAEARRSILEQSFGIDPNAFRFVFGSVHPEELDQIAGPIRRILADFKNVQVILAPRHPEKFTRPIVEKYFPGVPAVWIDAADAPPPNRAPLVWVNRLGVLRELYQMSNAAFVGGTFCEIGGHNLAEPALAGIPALYGPRVHAQIALHEVLQAHGAARQVATPEELHQAMAALIDGKNTREIDANLARLRAESAGLAARVAARITRAAGTD